MVLVNRYSMLVLGDRMMVLRRNVRTIAVLVAFGITIFICYRGLSLRCSGENMILNLDVKSSYHIWPAYVNSYPADFEWFQNKCFAKKFVPKIQSLQRNLIVANASNASLCRKFLHRFQNFYDLSTRTGNLKLPKQFYAKVSKWLGNDPNLLKEVQKQTIIHVMNKHTFEYTAYNPLRAKRPKIKPKDDPLLYIERLVTETHKSCDFCRFRQFTGEDDLGRMVTDLTATASNAFKFDSYHQILFPRKCHNPLKMTKEEVIDLFMTANRWFHKVHEADNSYKYPLLMWDSFPHGGASQVHPHIQISIDKFRYYGAMEMLRHAAEEYSKRSGYNSNYFTDLKDIHTALGLAYRHGSATAIAHLTAHKDFEVLLMSESANKDIFELLYFVVKALNADLKMYTFSFAGVFPKMENNARGNMPVFLRIVSRGVINSMNADISSLELFSLFNVNIDPYKVIQAIKESAEKRS